MSGIVDGGFTVMKVPGSAAGSCMFVRPHKAKRGGGKGGKGGKSGGNYHVLFVANVPPRWERSHVQELFSRFGDVTAVAVGELGRNRSTGPPTPYARVTFASADGVTRACQQRPLPARAHAAPVAPPDPPAWAERCLREYHAARPGREALKQWANDTMAAYERREAAQRATAAREAGAVDADGFTMVGRSKGAQLATAPDAIETAAGRGSDTGVVGMGAAAGGSAGLGAGRGANPRKRKKKKRTELKNFYRWQLREQKKQELEKLKADFQEDLRKIERMKQSKKLEQVALGQ